MHRKVTDLEKRIRVALPPSPAWNDLVPIIVAAARSSKHLLVTGEHGVGKSHLVRLIHDLRPEPRGEPLPYP
jgi:transcriptional regulator with AAA-type ATPase domain